MRFPTNFTWGVAAAAYQIEGVAAWDSKGPSVWDMLVDRKLVFGPDEKEPSGAREPAR